VEINKIHTAPIKEFLPEEVLGLEVATVFEIMGDVSGYFIIISSRDEAQILVNDINEKEFGSPLKKIDEDALSEVGNILTGNYLSALSEATGLSMQASMPTSTTEFNKGFLDGFLASFDKDVDSVLVVESTLIVGDKNIKEQLILVLKSRSFEMILNSLKGADEAN